MKLTGDRNQCPTCKEFFNSSAAFDKHRAGDFGIAAVKNKPGEYVNASRRCLSTTEMLGKGMGVSSAGFWVTALMDENTKPHWS